MHTRKKLFWMVCTTAVLACIFTICLQKAQPAKTENASENPLDRAHAGKTPTPASTATDATKLTEASQADSRPATADTLAVGPQQDPLLTTEEIETSLAAFSDWSTTYLAARPDQRPALEAEGVRLATERRPAFKQLIRKNPRRAIEASVPRVVRQDLPASITKLLEKPISAKGNLNVYLGKPAPGMPMPAEGLALRYFETPNTTYQVYVYGDLGSVTSRTGTPLRGVSIDGHLALAENAVRRLEVGERIPAGTSVEEKCPVSGVTTTAVAEGKAVTGDTPTVEIAGHLITLGNGSHVTVLEDDYRTYIQASGPGGGGFFIDNYPGTASRAIGNLRCLYMRVTYPDQMEQPNTEEQAYADMRDNARFFLENSYGKMTQTATVTPVLVLPQTLAWYKAKDAGIGGPINCLGLIHTDARAAAKAAGYDPDQFDCKIVRINMGPRLEGISWGGGDSVWITWNGMDVMNHEIGHSLNLNHAKYWTSLDGTAYGNGQGEEYGNIFDVMGNGYGFSAHYNTNCKRALDWLPLAYTHNPAINGTYRLYAYDQPRLEEGKRYSLRVAKDNVRTYNIEYHPASGSFRADGALVTYTIQGDTNCGHLLDTTPGSLSGKNDSPIALGRTYSDPEADMHFTVVSKNGTAPESIDVTYNKGPFPGNVSPTTTLAASATTIAAGDSVTFTATASDSNGDALAYHWEFSDGVGGTNSSVYTRTFPVAAQITAMLTVSDMKGGTVRCSTVINVGSHGKQTVSGTITASGLGLPGVYVSGDGKGCYANADGTYSLTGIGTGSKTLTATLPGYTFTPGFTNPLNVIAGNNTANWTATANTFVTLAKITDSTEGGSAGTFRFTRTGSTAADLTVLVGSASGSATKGTDYTFSPDYTASGSFYTFTIPSGSATLDVTVAATNDTAAEGPETIRLQVASGTGYYSSSTNAQVMTVADNDTSLPQVSVTAPDPYATEAPAGDPATFTFSRTGATTSSLDLAVAWSGTATNGTDYSTLSSTVTIAAGQNSTSVTLTPTNDASIEVPETAIATISANAAYVLAPSASTATATITDDDTPVVTVSVPDATASETGGDTGLFLFTRTGNTDASLKVYYGLSGSAAHSTDYARLTGEATIPAGATSAPVVITPVDDDIAEPSENVTLLLTTFNNAYSVGPANSGTITILDNSEKPLVNVRAGTDGTEGGSNTTFIFHAIGTGTGNITVNYTVSGTATSGSDYTALSGSISIPASGSSDTTLTVPILNDTALEPTETIILTINPSASYQVYNDGTAEGIIFDNDSGDRVMVSKFNQSPAEAGTTGAFYISRTGTTGALTVNYAMSGTATNGSDYNTLSGSVVIPDGAAGVDLTMTPINDTAVEGTETVTLTILSGTGYGVDVPSTATYTITDNESLASNVGFLTASSTTNELPGILGQFRDITVVLSAASANTITVDYYAGGGNAAGDNEDWAFVDASNGNSVIRQGTLTFAPGATTQKIRIRVNNDGVRETNETAIIQLARAWNAGIGNATHTITIEDTAGPQSVRLMTTATTRNETDGSEPMLQAILDRPAESAISVNYSATGTATAGSDYTLTGTTLSFAVGEQMKSIPLTLLTDAVPETPETIVVSLSDPVGAVLTTPTNHTITLTEGADPVVTPQFVSAASNQAAGTLITTASATLASGRTVSNWTILSGNTGNLFTLNASTGQLTLTTPASLPNPGGVQLIVRVTDNLGATGTGAINIICNAAANAVVEQRWTGDSAFLSENWSQASSYSGTLANLNTPENVAENYSRRLTSYLKPQVTGDYTFWVAGDDDCRLYLSTDGYEAHKALVAYVSGWTNYQAWDTQSSQKSVTIPLVAGQVYWIEAQQREGGGGDSLSVAWSGPGISRTVIPASVLVATAPGVSFPLPDSGTNTAPTISNVTDLSTEAGTSTGAIAFTVGDTETAAGALVVSASSSNYTLLPLSNIVLGGSGANRTVTLTPAQGQTGNVTVTLTVSDGLKSSSDTFQLTVNTSQIISFQSASGSGLESTSPVLIQVNMSPAKASPVTVDYETGGAATSGSDYTLTNGTLTFAPGETSKTISLAVISDSQSEFDETVIISLGRALGAVIGTNDTYSYTIINDDATPDPMNFALDTEGLTWTTSGDLPWFPQSATTKDGVDAAQSGAITDSQSSSMETTITGPGTLTFWWKASSESGWDFLRFYLDNVQQAGVTQISGEVDWVQKTVTIPTGSHVIKWTYNKDGSDSYGSDAAWVDQVIYTPAGGTYTVTFDANDGSTASPTSKSVINGSAYGTLATTSRASYSFAGWYTAASGGTLITAATVVTATTNHTLYAQWNVPPTVHAGADQNIAMNQIPWTPANMTTLAWYDASDAATITQSSNAVSLWKNKSIDNYHMAQSLTDNQPTTGTQTINGRNVIAFDGTNDSLKTSTNPFGASISNAMLMGVFNIGTINTQSTLFSLSGGAPADANRWQSHAPWNEGTVYFDCGGAGAPNRINIASGWAANQNKILGYYCSTTASTQQVWANGSLLVSDATGHTVNTVSGAAFGYDGSGTYDNAQFGEVILINNTVSTEDRQKLEGYLAHRWGMAANLPDGHPYKAAAPVITAAVATLDGTISDPDGGTLTATWSKFAGPAAAVTFGNTNAVDTTATFTTDGTYTLRLTANDTFGSQYDDCVITVGSAPASYTITFDSSGGSAISPITQTAGTTVTAPTNPTKTGYTFTGWSPAVPATMPASNTTCVAQWTINSYTISFDSAGGSAVTAITQNFGTAVTAPTNPTKTGYTFAGWSPTVPATMPASNTTCTAQWTAIPAPTITTISPTSGPVAGGTTVTITGTNLTGTSGVTFGETAATSVTVVSSTSVTCVTPAKTAGVVDVILTTPGGSVTKTGAFTYLVTYPVTYSGNGNSGGSAPADQSKLHDIDLPLRTNSGNLVKTSFVFAGWNTATDGNGTNHAAGSTYTANAPLTLYAKWVSDGGGTWIPTTAGPFNWGASANWTDSIVATGADKTASFIPNLTADQVVNLEAARTIGNILFTDSTTSSNNLTISGANILTLDRTTGVPAIDVTQADRTLTISSVVAGTDGLEKSGSGTLTLSGANTYTGTTTISAGMLRLEGTAFNTLGRTYSITSGAVMDIASGSIPAVTTTISGGGTLRVSAGISAGAAGKALTLSMGAGSTIDIRSGGGSIYNGGWSAITWSSNQATLNVDGSLSIVDGNAITADALTGAGAIASADSGAAAANFTLGVANGSGTYSGAISAAGTRVISLVKNGTGTQTFSGSTTWKGTTTINGGTVQYAKTSSLYAGVTTDWTKAKIIVNTGGTIAFNVGGTDEFTTDNITTLLSGLGGTVTNNGLRSGSTIAFDTTNASGGTFTIANTIANTTSTGGGAVGLRKLGNNTLVLSNTNSYTGTTTVSGGTLALGANDTLPPSSPVTIGAATLDAATFDDSTIGTLDVTAATSTINLGAGANLAFAASNGVDWSGGILNLSGTLDFSGTATSSLRFGTSNIGLTSTQLSQITSPGWTNFALNASGYLIATSRYSTWASTNATTGTPSDDFDNDGVPNAIEFVLGGDKDIKDLSKLPKAATSGGNMTFTFKRDRNSIGPNVTLKIEVSTNLTTWPNENVYTVGATSSGPITVTDNPDVPGTDTITLTLPQGADTKKFAHLKVEITP